MRFSITIANLGEYNEGKLHAEGIVFPAKHEDIAEMYNRVSYNGNNDVIIINDNAKFPIDQHEMLVTLENIGNLNEELYEGFLILAKHMPIREAYRMVIEKNFQIFREVKDLSDVAYQVLLDDEKFKDCPEFVRRHFDYVGYGEELDSMSQFYEDFSNQTLLEIFN